MTPIIFMIAIAILVMFLIYKSMKADYKRYNQTNSLSIIIGWFFFAMIGIFIIAGIVFSVMGGRVAEMSI